MRQKMRLISRQELEDIWDKLCEHKLLDAKIREIKVNDACFRVLYPPSEEVLKHEIYLPTGLAFFAKPRFEACHYRFVLFPAEGLGGLVRWEIKEQDIRDFIRWSENMKHVVTVSTFKSGASMPFALHAQSLPMKRKSDGQCLSALPGVDAKELISKGSMLHFKSLRIDQLSKYPIRGLKITGELSELCKKTYELALSYDHLKAYNIVILPSQDEDYTNSLSPAVYFFPRRKDGQAIYQMGNQRWQIAALEVNGLMQAKNQDEADRIDAGTIKAIFDKTSLNESEFEDFLKLLDSF